LTCCEIHQRATSVQGLKVEKLKRYKKEKSVRDNVVFVSVQCMFVFLVTVT